MTNIPERRTVPVIKVPQADGTIKEVSFTVQRAQEYWAAKARDDVKFYMEFIYGWKLDSYQHEWFDAALNLLNPESGKERLLIISPPGFGKTDWVLGWLSWNMGHKPWTTNAIVSVSEAQAQQRLDQLKMLVQFSDRYKLVFPWVDIDPHKAWTKSAMNIWDRRLRYTNFIQKRLQLGLQKTHSCMSSSTTGSNLVGNRISGFAIIDDPHDTETARSAKIRQQVIEWYYAIFLTRVIPHLGRSIIISTRWAEDDLAGTILEQPSTTLSTVITYAETTDEAGNRLAISPQRFPLETLDKIITDGGKRRYDAYYMHKVGALTGAVFQEEWLRKEVNPDDLPEFEDIIISVDPSITNKSTSDFAALAIVGFTKKHEMFALEMLREHMSSRDLGQKLEQFYNTAVQKYGFCEKIIIEKAGQQQILIDSLINETTLPILGVKYPGNKLIRASTLETYCSNGNFYAKWWLPWGKLLKNEMIDFPNGKNDDMVDCLAQAANYFSRRNKLTAKVGQLDPSLFIL